LNEEAFEWMDAPTPRVTALDAPVPHSGSLEHSFPPQAEGALTAAR